MQSRSLPSLAIVSPCFNEENLIKINLRKLIDLLEMLSNKQLIDFSQSSIYVVDDGSTDNSWKKLQEMNSTYSQIKCIKLSRNFGHQNALLAGIIKSCEEIVISIDFDLQDDLEAVEKMILKYNGGFEIVYGIKADRSIDGFLKKFFARSFYALLTLLGAKVIKNHADFRLMSKRAINSLRQYKENDIYLRGIIPLLGFKSSTVEYSLIKRTAGKTKYSFNKSISLALRGITSLTFRPLRIISFLGFLIAIFSIFMTFFYVFQSILYPENTVPGWASTVLPIYFLGAIQLISLGVIGEYIGKLFIETKNRPNFIIEDFLE